MTQSSTNDMAARWDERYRAGRYDGGEEPHDLVVRFAPLIPGPRVADIAMGAGRDALYLASQGFQVTGLEISREAVRIARHAMDERGLTVRMVVGDAAHLPFKERAFNGVIVFQFLMREICRDIAATLESDGILIYETFLKRQNELDRPRNPAFLLDDGELPGLFPGFEIIHYDEGVREKNGKVKATAQLVGKKI